MPVPWMILWVKDLHGFTTLEGSIPPRFLGIASPASGFITDDIHFSTVTHGKLGKFIATFSPPVGNFPQKVVS